jgi:hypothetical protein
MIKSVFSSSDPYFSTDYLKDEDKHVQSLLNDTEEIIKLLTTIIKSSQGRNNV